MKKLLLFASLFGVLAVNAQDKKAENVIKINAEKHNFGNIKQGVPVTTEFVITNISDQPLIIENVTAGCGCTTPKWSNEPVMAGGTTKIEVGFNAAAMNHFDKDVLVKIAGVSQPKTLKITGDVLDAAAYDAQAKEPKKAVVKNTDAGKVEAATKVKTKTTSKKTKIKSEKA